MSKRKRQKVHNNIYPDFNGIFRHIHSCLRDENGYIIRQVFDENKNVIRYELLSVKDVDYIKPSKDGRRTICTKQLNDLTCSVINPDYKGNLFKYCTHKINQELLPIDQFTTNETSFSSKMKNGKCLQPFCKESKKLYVNSNGNKKRTKDQLHEGSINSRFRSVILEACGVKQSQTYTFIYSKFDGTCFKCSEKIEIGDTSSKGLDHTLPLFYWYPITNETATFLCKDCNSAKRSSWPSFFYTQEKIKDLSKITNLPIETLTSSPEYNLSVIKYFLDNFEDVFLKISSFGRRNKIKKINLLKEFLIKEISNLEKSKNVHVLELVEKLKEIVVTL